MKNAKNTSSSGDQAEEQKDEFTTGEMSTVRSLDETSDDQSSRFQSTSRGVDESILVGNAIIHNANNTSNQLTFASASVVTSQMIQPLTQPSGDIANLLVAGGKAEQLLNEDSLQQFHMVEDATGFAGSLEDERSSTGANSALFATTLSQPALLINSTGRSSLWQKPSNENMFQIQNWNDLQDKLKEEYNLIVAESAQKQKLQEELENSHLQYYRTYIELLELEEVSKEQSKFGADEVVKKKVLMENTYKLFKDADSFAKSILMAVAQNPKLLASIIKTQGNQLDEATKSLIRTIVNTFYDNIIDEEVWDQDIMIFIANVIKFEVDQAKTPEDIRFKSNQVLHKILNEFTKRQDFQRYTKYIFKGPLQYITKASKIVICPKTIYENLRKKQATSTPVNNQQSSVNRKVQQSQAGPLTQSSSTPQQSQNGLNQSAGSLFGLNQSSSNVSMSGGSQLKNSASKYEQILRQYDSGSGSNGNANIISSNVMKIVGLGEESKSARFHARQATVTDKARPSTSSVSPMNTRRLSPNKSGTPDNRRTDPQLLSIGGAAQRTMQENVTRVLKKNVQTLRNLTNNVFDSIFKNLYNIPVPIRITCKIIEIITRAKFTDISDSSLYTIIGYFLFDCYLIPQFMFSHHLRQVNLIKDEHENNLFEIKKLMKNIYRRELYHEQEEVNCKHFNPLINELTPSIEDYFQELLSINDDAVHKIITHDTHSQNKMKVYCVCITLENVQTLCNMIERNHAEIHKINPQVADNARRVMRISEDSRIFDERKDLDIPGSHRPSHIYTILIDINMPKDLQTNYEREYKMHYAVTKHMSAECTVTHKDHVKGEEHDSSSASFDRESYSNMELIELFKIFEDGYYLHNAKHSNQVDNVPIMIKAKYLMNILKQIPSKYQENNMRDLFHEMNREFTDRFEKFMSVSNHTKSELLKARNTIKKYQSILKENIDLLNRDKKRRILFTFIEKQPLHLCITSEKSRAGLRRKTNVNTSSNITSGSADEEDSVITICSTDSCIHTQTNFDFVLGLTQGTSAADTSSTARKKELYEAVHCKDIISFIDIFASLPEVQEVVTSGRNIPAINAKFSQFIEELFEVVKQNPLFAQYSLADQDWINNQLEMYITRKLYDQIFPKEKTYADTAMYCRMKVLSWIDYSHLEIDKTNRVDEMWDISAKALLSMDFVKSPSEKLDCLIESTTIMTNVLKLTQVNEGAASADSILPISIYILLKACPTRLYSNIKLIYEKEMEYGIYFLKKRPRATRVPINKELVEKVIKDIEARKQAAITIASQPEQNNDTSSSVGKKQSNKNTVSFGGVISVQVEEATSPAPSPSLLSLKANQVFSVDYSNTDPLTQSLLNNQPIRASTGSFSGRVILESHALSESEQERLNARITNNRNSDKYNTTSTSSKSNNG